MSALTVGDRVKAPMHGTGSIVEAGNPDPRYAQTNPVVVQFDNGKRYVVLAKRLRRL